METRKRLRLLTLNLWQEQGPWRERLAWLRRLLEQLAPDVLALQEVRQAGGRVPNQAASLAADLHLEHAYATAHGSSCGEEGLAILSRWPILAHETHVLPTAEGRFRRICLGARIDLGGSGAASIFTAHLAYRLEDGHLRALQVHAMERFARKFAPGTSGLRVLCGDFNAIPDADEIRFLRGLTSLQGERAYYQDAFEACNPGADGHTWSRSNPYTEHYAWFPSRRVDYVFVSAQRPDGVGTIHSCRVVCTEPSATGVRASDHYGVLAEIGY